MAGEDRQSDSQQTHEDQRRDLAYAPSLLRLDNLPAFFPSNLNFLTTLARPPSRGFLTISADRRCHRTIADIPPLSLAPVARTDVTNNPAFIFH